MEDSHQVRRMTSSQKLCAVLVRLPYVMQVIGAQKVFHLKIMLKNNMLLLHNTD